MADLESVKAANMYVDKGRIYFAGGEHTQVIEEISSAIRLNPECWIGYYMRGYSYYRLGKYKEASSDLQWFLLKMTYNTDPAVIGSKQIASDLLFEIKSVLAAKEKEAREAAEKKAREAKEAVEKLRTAAEQGDAQAQCELGVLYENGQGVPKDHRKAAEWFGKAAAQGHAEAKEWLAKKAKEKRKRLFWYVFNIVLGGIIGAIIAVFMPISENKSPTGSFLIFGIVFGVIAGVIKRVITNKFDDNSKPKGGKFGAIHGAINGLVFGILWCAYANASIGEYFVTIIVAIPFVIVNAIIHAIKRSRKSD